MTRSARARSLLTSTVLPLVATGCLLDPESVGEASSESSGETSQAIAASDGAETTTADAIPEGAGEVLEEWDGIEYDRVIRYPEGDVLVLGKDLTIDGDTFFTFEVGGRLVGSDGYVGRYFEDFEVGADGFLVLGGRADNGVDPIGAYLWPLGDDGGIPVYEVMLASGASVVAEVAVGGGMLWTVTHEAAAPEDSALAVLRRHDLQGVVQATVPLLAPATTLAVDADGFAYSIAQSEPPQLHRVAPDGNIVWSLPVEPGVTGLQLLHARPGAPGVVVVSEVAGGRHVEELDGDGVSLHEFLTPGMTSPLPPASDVGDAILLANPLAPDAYVVEAHANDGALLWSATRTVAGASSVVVADVLEIPGGAVVVGRAQRNGSDVGFVRFVVAP